MCPLHIYNISIFVSLDNLRIYFTIVFLLVRIVILIIRMSAVTVRTIINNFGWMFPSVSSCKCHPIQVILTFIKVNSFLIYLIHLCNHCGFEYMACESRRPWFSRPHNMIISFSIGF